MQNNEGKSKIRKFIDDNIGEENINKAKKNLTTGIKESAKFINKTIEDRKVEKIRQEEIRKKEVEEYWKKYGKYFIGGFVLMIALSIGLMFYGGDSKDEAVKDVTSSEAVNNQVENNQPPVAVEEISKNENVNGGIGENNNNDEIINSQEEVITIENNPEFAEIMDMPENVLLRNKTTLFAEENKDKILAFNGTIVYKADYTDFGSNTYSFSIQSGDYVDAETVNPGPTFILRHVDKTDLYNNLNMGDNIYIKAKIDGYNENGTSLFVLKPIEIRKR